MVDYEGEEAVLLVRECCKDQGKIVGTCSNCTQDVFLNSQACPNCGPFAGQHNMVEMNIDLGNNLPLVGFPIKQLPNEARPPRFKEVLLRQSA